MALALRRSSSRSRTPTHEPSKELEDSVKNFEAILSDSDRAWLKKIKAVPDADAVMVFTAELDALNRQKKGRSIGTRLHGALQSVRDFTAVVDTFVSSHPEIAALVWGSIKLTMLLVANYVSYFEEISGLFMRFKSLCPRFEEYHALFPTSKKLQLVLCNFNAAIVRCCKHVVEALQRSKKKQLLNALLQSFEKEFAPDVAEIERLSREVKEEILLAKATADHQHQKIQIAEAEETKSRLLSVISISRRAADDLKEMRLQRDQLLLRQERLEVLKAVSSYDNRKPFKEACQKRHYKTAEWIFSTSQFQRWKSKEQSPVLWSSGKIGSGKTIITASAIDHIARTKPKDARVAYHFVQYNDSQSLEAETIVRSIIRQLLDINNIPKELEMKLKSMDINLIPRLESWLTLLREVILASVCYIFVDGLDECHVGEQRKLLDAFSVLTDACPELRIFISGRLSLSKEIVRVFPKVERLLTSSADAAADISTYIKETLQGKIELEDLIINDTDLVLEIESRLLQHADGMFLWVTYLIDELCTQRCDKDIRKTLENLPKDLEETFNRVLSRIMGPRQTIAQKVFPWVAVAKRNLTIDELCQAASLDIGQDFLGRNPPLQGESIIRWCENLLYLDEEYQTVQFAHRSIHDFIISERPESKFVDFHVNTAKADHFAGDICLTFMHLNDFQTTVARRMETKMKKTGITPGRIAATSISHRKSLSTLMKIIKEPNPNKDYEKHDIRPYIQTMASYQRVDGSMETLENTYPFWRYVAEHWLGHTTQFTRSSQTFKLWEHVIRDGHGIAETPWCGKEFDRSKIDIFEWATQNGHRGLITYVLTATRLSDHVKKKAAMTLASQGETELLDVLFSHAKSIKILNAALQEACANGHIDTVNRTLQAGADPEENNDIGTALAIACLHGHIDIVLSLLSADAKVNPARGVYTPLQAAALKGNLQIVRVLLKSGADPKSPAADTNGLTALQAACKLGHIKIAKYLCEQGVDVNAPAASVRGRTALQAACESGNALLVEFLLEIGADIHGPPSIENGRTALQAACEGGYFDIAHKLCQSGADVQTRGARDGGVTALQAASAGGNLDIVLKLMDYGAYDVVDFGRFGNHSALWEAARNGHMDIVSTLVQHGLEDIDYSAALQAAAEGGHLEIIEFLLARNRVAFNPKFNRDHARALQAAAENGHMDIVSTLVQHGVEDFDYSAALQAAAEGGHLEIIEFLLARNRVTFNPKFNPDHAEALQAAAENGHLQVIEYLLAKDTNFKATALYMIRSLQFASYGGHIDVVRRLIRAGVNVNAPPATGFGKRALQAASGSGHFQVVKELLAAGADLNAVNDEGETALHAASQLGQLDIVGLLIDEGADVWVEDVYSKLPIHVAAECGNVEVVQLLYPRFIAITSRQREQLNRTLQLARWENQIEVIEFLSQWSPVNFGK